MKHLCNVAHGAPVTVKTYSLFDCAFWVRNVFVATCFAMVLSLLVPAFAFAHAVPDLSQTGSITLNLTYNGQAVTGGEFALTLVGDITEADGNYSFEKNAVVSGWSGSFENLEDSSLAQELANYVDSAGVSVTANEANSSGTVVFENVEPGLYLVQQVQESENFQEVLPFLVSVPQNEKGVYIYNVNATPKIGTLVPQEPAPTPNDSTLPQTGLLWWPVPVLLLAGLAFIIVGLFRRKANSPESGK